MFLLNLFANSSITLLDISLVVSMMKKFRKTLCDNVMTRKIAGFYFVCYRILQNDRLTQLKEGAMATKFLLLKRSFIDYICSGNVDERIRELDAAPCSTVRMRK